MSTKSSLTPTAPSTELTADFHAHTTASDGTDSPEALVRAAARAGVSYLAVTDHDTAKSVAAAVLEAQRLGTIKLLPGVELSARGKPGSCHLLALGVNHAHPALSGSLEALLAARNDRNVLLAERLTRLGAPVTVEEVTRDYAPPGANLGRPHFALALIGKGYVQTMQEAFDRFLGDAGAAFVPKDDLSPADAIALAHDVGGLCFWAHPGLTRLDAHETMETRVRAYKEAGLDGIEAYYSRHSEAQTASFLRLAAKYDLLVTGGSDYHGTNRPGTFLNRILEEGTKPLPARLVAEELLRRTV